MHIINESILSITISSHDSSKTNSAIDVKSMPYTIDEYVQTLAHQSSQ